MACSQLSGLQSCEFLFTAILYGTEEQSEWPCGRGPEASSHRTVLQGRPILSAGSSLTAKKSGAVRSRWHRRRQTLTAPRCCCRRAHCSVHRHPHRHGLVCVCGPRSHVQYVRNECVLRTCSAHNNSTTFYLRAHPQNSNVSSCQSNAVVCTNTPCVSGTGLSSKSHSVEDGGAPAAPARAPPSARSPMARSNRLAFIIRRREPIEPQSGTHQRCWAACHHCAAWDLAGCAGD
jgi:hypothetical protein